MCFGDWVKLLENLLKNLDFSGLFIVYPFSKSKRSKKNIIYFPKWLWYLAMLKYKMLQLQKVGIPSVEQGHFSES